MYKCILEMKSWIATLRLKNYDYLAEKLTKKGRKTEKCSASNDALMPLNRGASRGPLNWTHWSPLAQFYAPRSSLP
jgi:hypothetical protein